MILVCNYHFASRLLIDDSTLYILPINKVYQDINIPNRTLLSLIDEPVCLLNGGQVRLLWPGSFKRK